LVVVLNFAMIGALPAVTFRGGRLTAAWWATASPLILAVATVIAAWVGVFSVDQTTLVVPREVLVTVSALASATLMAYTAGSHRIPLSLWHQHEDAPVEIVTWGPYRVVRHPFYVSFLLTLVAALALVPSWPTVLTLIGGVVALQVTAAREERRLMSSELGEQYTSYRDRTGRFVPRLSARGSAS
jgi:protein-S-isoprenylcysteine O-methyltransferase Ste14